MSPKPESRSVDDATEEKIAAAAAAFVELLQGVAREINPRDLPREHMQIVLTLGYQSLFQGIMTAYRPPEDAPDSFHAVLFETALIGVGLSVGAIIARLPQGPARTSASQTLGDAVNSELTRADAEAFALRVEAAKGHTPAPNEVN